ncbi:uncharacterized protein TNCV_1866091 [Trichonephila clavipes]|nr:uncharacterized protein TNCV_1866091 [Trichonephila clavipes]
MIGKLEEGRSSNSAAEAFKINKSVVSRAWKAFQIVDTAVRKVDGGHPRKTTAVDHRYIVLQKKKRDNSQQVPVISNCIQEPSDKCRDLK